jgi:GTP-binding protein HflX
MEPQRATRRAERERAGIAAVAIVGYTNAGKSSLLRALTGADVLVDNQLFATLDPTIRALKTSEGRVYTVADTVGFVRHLPHQLVDAFSSTLEESVRADLLLHVVDASHPDPEGQISAGREVLREIGGAAGARELLVFTKADVARPDQVEALLSGHPGAMAVSVVTAEGMAELLVAIEAALPHPPVEVDLVVPFTRGDLVARAHSTGEVLGQTYEEHGTRLRARVGAALAAELAATASG